MACLHACERGCRDADFTKSSLLMLSLSPSKHHNYTRTEYAHHCLVSLDEYNRCVCMSHTIPHSMPPDVLAL